MLENMRSNKMNKAEVDGNYLRSGETMQSLKWFLLTALVGAVKNSIGQMKCLEKLSHASSSPFVQVFCSFLLSVPQRNMQLG